MTNTNKFEMKKFTLSLLHALIPKHPSMQMLFVMY